MGRNPTSDDRPPNPCPICDGKGTIIHIEKGKITCPSCRGRGTKGGK